MKGKFPKQDLITQILFLLIIGAILSVTIPNLTYAVTKTTIVSGLQAAVGAVLDESNNQLYFVEYNPPGNGALKRINLPPQCGTSTTPPCSDTIVPIATGFSHPEDVQLDLAHGFAYVTTRDDPGTTGALWKVNISTGSKSLVTFNLGGPQQLVLDIPNNQAYTVGYNDGRLRRINLTTGAKTPIFIGLSHPVGLAITNDRKYAYITEQDAPARISKIDLTTGVKISEIVLPGLTAPFFLAWTDKSQNSLYVVERDPANKVSRVDLTINAKNNAITGLPWRPSGIVVSSLGTPVYVTSDSEITKVDLVELTGPVFMGVGHVPATSIVDGYATTDPGYFFQVKHSPFGGTLNIFGNLTKFRVLGATHYAVLVSKDGGTFEPLNLSWNMYKWNTTTLKYDLVPVVPNDVTTDGTPVYPIPLEADGNYHPEFWYPPFLFMRWPSGENGLYTFMVKIYQKSGTTWKDLTKSLPAALNSLTLRIDNTPPDVKILSIWQKGPPDNEIKPCDIVTKGNNKYYFKITAYDPNHHLRYYCLKVFWGENKSGCIYNDSYSYHDDVGEPDYEGLYLWSGKRNFSVPRDICGSTGSATTWEAECDCAYTFYLHAGKRTIDGYNYILSRRYHKSITINNTGVTCDGESSFSCPCP
ncbi:MAG: hypothetical protein DRP81_05780 [Candidatus Omnitrophota bacterium]|nr:MAG: hypothetical protein DRP81_05780 [Candidatus Omnitrophota bacterium]